MNFPKVYIGDGVYAEHDGYHIILTTQDGQNGRPNRIALEPGLTERILQYSHDCIKMANRMHVPLGESPETLDDAAHAFHRAYADQPGFHSVGVGLDPETKEPALHVYVYRGHEHPLLATWSGYKIIFHPNMSKSWNSMSPATDPRGLKPTDMTPDQIAPDVD